MKSYPKLQLVRPLACVDLETTGTQAKVDRIVQIAVVKMYPDGRVEEWETLVNPGLPIPPECTRIHGITDEMVASAPLFASREVAGILAAGLVKCDIAGYNHYAFDIPMLKEEFKRAGLDPVKIFEGARFIDAFKIFQRKEPRTLAAAVEKYLGEKHEDAHSALGDVRATLRVLAEQVEKYNLPTTVYEMHEYLFEEIQEGNVDPEGKIVLRNGVAVLNFSRHAGIPISQVDDGFLRWALRQDFNAKVKEVFTTELKRRG